MTCLRVAYLGHEYHGVAKQPGLRTIAGELDRALSEMGVEASGLSFTSRTDSGVSALDNVAFLKSEIRPKLSWLNSLLPRDISVWAAASCDSFPKVIKKTYIYSIPFKVPSQDLESSLIRASTRSDLCREGSAPPPEEITVQSYGPLTIVKISGRRFCWRMIRRLVAASLKDLGYDLRAELPAEGLILVRSDVNFTWEEFYTKKLKTIERELKNEAWWWGAGLILGEEIAKVISSAR